MYTNFSVDVIFVFEQITVRNFSFAKQKISFSKWNSIESYKSERENGYRHLQNDKILSSA